jgi:hypothetical protein
VASRRHPAASPSPTPRQLIDRKVTMSKRARALILGATLAAMNLAGLTAVAHAQANDPDGKVARRLATERQAGEPRRHGQVTSHEQTAADAALRRVLARERFSIPSGTPAQVTAPAPTEPNGRPGWLLPAELQARMQADAAQRKLAERWSYYSQATRMSPAELKAWMQAKDRPDTPTQPPTQVPAAPVQPTTPSGQPTWLVVSLGGLAAALALVAGLALLAARRANRRAQVGHAT